MDELKVREWLDTIVEAKNVINENVFFNPEKKYDDANICNVEYMQLAGGGHLPKIASLLGLELIVEPLSDKQTLEYSFVYKGIKFLSLESLVKEEAGTDRE